MVLDKEHELWILLYHSGHIPQLVLTALLISALVFHRDHVLTDGHVGTALLKDCVAVAVTVTRLHFLQDIALSWL